MELEKSINKYKNLNTNILIAKLDKIKINHNKNKLKCPFCNKKLSSLLNYYSHINKFICRRDAKNTCEKCKKYFSRKIWNKY